MRPPNGTARPPRRKTRRSPTLPPTLPPRGGGSESSAMTYVRPAHPPPVAEEQSQQFDSWHRSLNEGQVSRGPTRAGPPMHLAGVVRRVRQDLVDVALVDDRRTGQHRQPTTDV